MFGTMADSYNKGFQPPASLKLDGGNVEEAWKSKYDLGLPSFETGFATENCSFPFTLGGQLFHTCTRNSPTSCKVGCFLARRVWKTCVESTDYEAKYATINVTIPAGSSSSPCGGGGGGCIPLMSIQNWIIIQQRVDDSVDFNRPWNDYKTGFGDIATNFWLGLESMYQMTCSGGTTMMLRIEIQSADNDKWFSSEYDTFLIDSESQGYAIHVTGYVGDSGDGMNVPKVNGATLNGRKFTTADKDNDRNQQANCATFVGGGGFWFDSCCYMSLNQPYGSEYFYWHHLTDLKLAATMELKTSRMMVKTV